MIDEAAMTILEASPVLRDVAPATREAVMAAARTVRVPAGQAVISEGEQSCDLYVLAEGTAVVRRSVAGEPEALEVGSVERGELFGELAFLDNAPRASTVRAVTDCAFLMISHDALLARPDAAAVLGDLRTRIGSLAAGRAREFSNDALAALREQLRAQKFQNQFGHFLVFTIALFMISSTLFYLVAERYVRNAYDPSFAWQAVLLLAIPGTLIIWYLKIPLADLGIRRQGLWRALGEGAALCAAITAVALAIVLGTGVDIAPGDGGATIDWFFFVSYAAHSVVQEVGARGLLQGLFQRFLADERGHRSVLLTSIVFANLHLAFGFDAVVVTFVASILFGYIYLRHKNLAGVILVHYWLGSLAAILVLL